MQYYNINEYFIAYISCLDSSKIIISTKGEEFNIEVESKILYNSQLKLKTLDIINSF